MLALMIGSAASADAQIAGAGPISRAAARKATAIGTASGRPSDDWSHVRELSPGAEAIVSTASETRRGMVLHIDDAGVVLLVLAGVNDRAASALKRTALATPEAFGSKQARFIDRDTGVRIEGEDVFVRDQRVGDRRQIVASAARSD